MTKKDILKQFGHRSNIRSKRGDIRYTSGELMITWFGTDDSTPDDIEDMLRRNGFPTIETLKKTFKVVRENGSSTYFYQLRLDLDKPLILEKEVQMQIIF